jgi:predicted membrane protein
MTIDTQELEKNHNKGKREAGLIVVAVGILLLLKTSGVLLPAWLFSWQMLLITIGAYIGFRHSFRSNTWWIMISIGVVFLIDDFFYEMSIKQFFWPILIIAIGLAMIFGRRKKRWDGTDWKENYKHYETVDYESSDRLDSVAIFGSVRKNIVSKDFKGGEMVSVFGGSELNLSQAEIKGHVTMELVNIMGGTKLIIPANWELRTEIVSIFGGIEDKRPQQSVVPNGENVLILRGTSLFGGIDIKSF